MDRDPRVPVHSSLEIAGTCTTRPNLRVRLPPCSTRVCHEGMSDTENTEQKLTYSGTTATEGTGEKPKKMGSVSAEEFGIDNLQPGVGDAEENPSPLGDEKK
jgi:hypothetical protein